MTRRSSRTVLPPAAMAILTALALAWPAQAQSSSISVVLEPASPSLTTATAVDVDIVVENAADAAIRAFEIHLHVEDPEDSISVVDARPETSEIEIREQGEGMALDRLAPLWESPAGDAQYLTVRNLSQEESGTITYAVTLLGSPDPASESHRAASLSGDRLVLGSVTLLGRGPGTARIFFHHPTPARDRRGAPLLDEDGNPVFGPAVKLAAFHGDGEPVLLEAEYADRNTPAAIFTVGEVTAQTSLRQDTETVGGAGVAVVALDLDGMAEAGSGEGIHLLDDATGGLKSFRAAIAYGGEGDCLRLLDARSDLGGFSFQETEPGVLVVESADMGALLTPSETNLARLVVRLAGSATQSCNLEIKDADFRLGSGAAIPGTPAGGTRISLRRGDASGDGLVDVRDARRIARHLAGLAAPPLLPVNCASVAHDEGGDRCDERDLQAVLERELQRVNDNYDEALAP